MNQITDIRDRVIKSEKASLMKKAERRFPGQKKRQEQFVYRTLAGRYGFRKNENQVEIDKTNIPPGPPSKGGRLTMEELMALPLEGCEILFTIVNSVRR